MKIDKLTSESILEKANIISYRIYASCLIKGKNTIKFPSKLINEINLDLFKKDYDVVIDNNIEKIFIYRSDINTVKYFLQEEDNEIIGAGIKFNNKLSLNESFVEIKRLCGEITII